MQGHLRLQSNAEHFDIAFVIAKFRFCGALFKRILACEQGIFERKFSE